MGTPRILGCYLESWPGRLGGPEGAGARPRCADLPQRPGLAVSSQRIIIPGERLIACRQLTAEAGAPRGERRYFADSTRLQLYRPHLLHARAYWAHTVARVQAVATTVHPPGPNQVTELLTLAPSPVGQVRTFG